MATSRQAADHPAVDRDDDAVDVRRRAREQERTDAPHLRRLAVPAERDPLAVGRLDVVDGHAGVLRPRRVERPDALRVDPARSDAVHANRRDLADEALDEAVEAGT